MTEIQPWALVTFACEESYCCGIEVGGRTSFSLPVCCFPRSWGSVLGILVGTPSCLEGRGTGPLLSILWQLPTLFSGRGDRGLSPLLGHLAPFLHRRAPDPFLGRRRSCSSLYSFGLLHSLSS